MGRKRINRTGEERLNKFGSKMIIREYRGALDIDVYFPQYDWTFEHAQYTAFKRGTIKCLRMVKIEMNIKFGIV